jgi:hypothetical protein
MDDLFTPEEMRKILASAQAKVASRAGPGLEVTPSISGPFGIGPNPKRIDRAYDITVRFSMKTEGFEEAARRLRKVLSGDDDLVLLLEKAVMRSVVANVRKRFVARMEVGMEMESLIQNGRKVQISPRERMRDMKLKARLSDTLARLSESQMAGESEVAAKLSDRAIRIGEQLRDRQGLDPRGKAIGHRLSQLAGNQFRTRMQALLRIMVDARFVRSERNGKRIRIDVGQLSLLNQIETPSATEALRGYPTGSRYKILWRQLEFGTGAKRSAAKDRAGGASKPAKQWWYGKREDASILLKGTLPMNFLTNNEGQIYQEDMDALGRELTRVLDNLLSGNFFMRT